jgi:hypothetical protein
VLERAEPTSTWTRCNTWTLLKLHEHHPAWIMSLAKHAHIEVGMGSIRLTGSNTSRQQHQPYKVHLHAPLLTCRATPARFTKLGYASLLSVAQPYHQDPKRAALL